MRSRQNRREFLFAAGIGVATGVLSPTLGRAQSAPGPGGTPGAPGSSVRIRKSFTSSAAQNDVTSLRRGVDEMKKLIAKDPKDPRGWALQSFIHGTCNGFASCQHGTWYFAPWHRSYVYYFEQLIQYFSGDPGFALPYWDWTRVHSIPGFFYGNALDDTISIRSTCSSAPTAGRGRTASDSFSQSDLDAFVGPAVVDRIQANPDFATYGGTSNAGGALERTPHNFVHRWVGGSKQSNMVQFFSPLDPIFWMHHCNVDRLYSNWIARWPSGLPQQSAWRDKSFNDFYDRSGRRVGGELTCWGTVDTTVLGYRYDSLLEIPPHLIASSLESRKEPALVASMVASKPVVEAGVLSFLTDVSAPGETRRLMNAAAIGLGDHVARLRIEAVKRPHYQNTAVHVFLGPGITADSPITAPGYVGSFTFFDGHGDGTETGHGSHGGSSNIVLNASEALRRLYGDTGLPEGSRVEVSLVTRELFTGVEFEAVERIQPDRVHLDVVDLTP